MERASEILRIEPLLKRKPRQLSGGQRQRVAIGRAIVREPQIFLFDEPLSNLDAELRVQMRVEIAKLHNELGNTMIYVTHDQVEAMTMADKIVVLSAGNIEQVGAPLDLYNKPRNKFVAGFLGSPKMNFVEGTIASLEGMPTVNVGGTMVQLTRPLPGFGPKDKVTFGVRPEHLSITDNGGAKFADVRVDLVEQLGDTTMLYAATQGGQPLTIALEGQRQIATGTMIPTYIDRGALSRVRPGRAGAAVSGELFAAADASAWIIVAPGNRRRVLVSRPELMQVEFAFDEGAVGALHSHPHVQASYVAEGRFEVTIGEVTMVLSEGGSFIVPPDVVHGVKALTAGRLVDCFAPRRDDFL